MKKVNFSKFSVHDTPSESPGYLLWRVSTTWRSKIEQCLKEFDLTHPQFVILATLSWFTRNGDIASQADIGRLAGLDPNTTSQIIRGLEKKEFIMRKRLVDERSKNPVVTKLGLSVLKKAMPAVEQADKAFFEILSKTDEAKIMKIFLKLLG